MKFCVGFLFLLFCFPIIAFCSSCPNGSIEFQNHCYFFISNATQFPDAELSCNGMNGHLASIHNGFTNAILTSESSKYFHDSTTVDFWIGLNTLMSPSNWSWTDNTTFDFKDWSPSEPKNLSMSCSALTIQNGYWASSDCFKIKPYVCEVSVKSYPIYMNCSTGWVYFEPTHSCYGHDGYGRYPNKWTESEKLCLSQGAHLVSLHSYDELKFVSTLFSLTQDYAWTGLYSNDDEKTWKWSDNSPVDYLPWPSGYPSRNISSCVLVWAETIIDYPCEVNSYWTMCKKPALT